MRSIQLLDVSGCSPGEEATLHGGGERHDRFFNAAMPSLAVGTRASGPALDGGRRP